MPDPYVQITDADPAVLDVLIDAMELRAADPRQRAVRKAFLSKVDLPDGARVLEAGCGSGAGCRELALHPEVSEVVGLDPSPVFLEKARELAAAVPNLRFDEGDARSLPYEDGEFDAVVFHTLDIESYQSYGYMQTSYADYMLTLIDRGAQLLVDAATIDAGLAEELKREARRRIEDNRFFGFIAFAGLIARSR